MVGPQGIGHFVQRTMATPRSPMRKYSLPYAAGPILKHCAAATPMSSGLTQGT